MNNPPAQQRGAALVIVLAVLVIVTLLAVSSMHEVVLGNRIVGSVIEQTRLQNAAGSRLREGERRFVNTLRPSEPGIGCMADNVARSYLLNLTAPKPKLAGARRNPAGVLKGITDIWTSYCGSNITSAATAGTLCSMQWDDPPISSGGQVNEAESPEYDNLIHSIGTLYYEANSVAHNQTNSETALQTVLARLYTN